MKILRYILLAVLILAVLFLILMIFRAYASQKDEATVAGGVRTDGQLFAFGSCDRQDRPQPFWPAIAAFRPDAFIWMGDNIYSDTEDMTKMAADYETLRANPGYRDFAARTPIFGTWDDHDYGANDAGKEYPKRDSARALLFDFLDVPADSPDRNHAGAYQRYDLGTAAAPVRLILLDTRYFRDDLVGNYDPEGRRTSYQLNEQGDILGEEQWAWLEEQLTDSPAAAHLIVSSIQVLPVDHPYEKWANFPAARRRLFELLEAKKPANLLLLSGDRHLGEISRLTTPGGLELTEMTASGLTHSFSGTEETNQYRQGPLMVDENFGLLLLNADGTAGRIEIRSIDGQQVAASLDLFGPAKTADWADRLLTTRTGTQPLARLGGCPTSPNCVTSYETSAAAPAQEPLAFNGTAAEAAEKLVRVIGTLDRTTLVSQSAAYFHYTFKTTLLPFVDDVEFLIDEPNQVIHYRTASREGYSDMGANLRRVKTIRQAWKND